MADNDDNDDNDYYDNDYYASPAPGVPAAVQPDPTFPTPAAPVMPCTDFRAEFTGALAARLAMPVFTSEVNLPRRGPYIIHYPSAARLFVHFHRLREEHLAGLCAARQLAISAGWEIVPWITGGIRRVTTWQVRPAVIDTGMVVAAVAEVASQLRQHGIATAPVLSGTGEAMVTLTLSELAGLAGWRDIPYADR